MRCPLVHRSFCNKPILVMEENWWTWHLTRLSLCHTQAGFLSNSQDGEPGSSFSDILSPANWSWKEFICQNLSLKNTEWKLARQDKLIAAPALPFHQSWWIIQNMKFFKPKIGRAAGVSRSSASWLIKKVRLIDHPGPPGQIKGIQLGQWSAV